MIEGLQPRKCGKLIVEPKELIRIQKGMFIIMKTNTISSLALLVLIALGFASFAVVDWVWIIPNGIWERSLAERFFVSSIFTMLTIVLLNVLIIWWEQRSWRHVKKEVSLMIQEELGIIFLLILDFIENGLMIKNSLTKENAFSKLCELKESEGLPKLNTALKALLEDKTSIKLFTEIKQNINNVELKYSRFLTPKLNRSLIKIQYSLSLLERGVQMHQKILPMMNEEKEQVVSTSVSASFKVLMDEIYNIHREGIEFSPILI